MLYIIGVGSHADVIQDILHSVDVLINFLQISIEEFESKRNEFLSSDQFICAIGDNTKRKHTVHLGKSTIQPHQWINAIHKSAVVSSQLNIGVGNVICAGAIVQTQSTIGNHCIINTHASIDHHAQVDDFVHVAPNVAVCGNVHLGEGVFLGTSSSVMPKLTLSPWSFTKAGTIVKQSSGPIPMYQPMLKEEYFVDLQTALEAGALTSQTPHCSFVRKAEDWLSKTLGVTYTLLMNNGTSATHCLYLALRFKYPKLEKIYLPNHVYVAVWNTALYEYDPSMLEVLPVDPHTLNMPQSEEFLHTLAPNAAVVIVHNVGNVINVPRMKRIRPDLILVEDNCEGLFGRHESSFTGSQSLCSSCSFFANKSLTSGEGGAFFTSDPEVYQYIKKIYSQGMTQERYVHDALGYNYRITNLQAALLYSQLMDSQFILQKKKEVFDDYASLLTHSAIQFVQLEPQTQHANWIIIVRIHRSHYAKASMWFQTRLIETRPFFYDIHRHKHLASIANPTLPFVNADEWIMFPSFPTLSTVQRQYIAQCINEYCTTLNE